MEIQEHLGVTIPLVDNSFEIPVDEFDGKVAYGEKRSGEGMKYESHTELLASSVEELTKLEYLAQLTFLNMRKQGSSW